MSGSVFDEGYMYSTYERKPAAYSLKRRMKMGVLSLAHVIYTHTHIKASVFLFLNTINK